MKDVEKRFAPCAGMEDSTTLLVSADSCTADGDIYCGRAILRALSTSERHSCSHHFF